MKGDYHRVLAEFSRSHAKNKAAEDSHVAYIEAARVLQNPDEARKIARMAFDVKAKQVVPQEHIIRRDH